MHAHAHTHTHTHQWLNQDDAVRVQESVIVHILQEE